MDLTDFLKSSTKQVDEALDRFLPPAETEPSVLHEAMRYCVFSGGKKLRPILCLAAAEACGGDLTKALPAACSVELIHAYSLVHDDLPCMDDDDLRRGRPTCHKVYGEGIAVLCGDALLTAAFRSLADTASTQRWKTSDFLIDLADASGSKQLIGGQVLDLQSEGKAIDHSQLVAIHRAKTAALLTCSVRLGAMTADATAEALAQLTKFGQALGLAFQIIDDILDLTQSTEVLGKTAGKDIKSNKATYPALLGLDGARAEAEKITQHALNALQPFGTQAHYLRALTEQLLQRHA